jgi:hypothetical protein
MVVALLALALPEWMDWPPPQLQPPLPHINNTNNNSNKEEEGMKCQCQRMAAEQLAEHRHQQQACLERPNNNKCFMHNVFLLFELLAFYFQIYNRTSSILVLI